MIQQKKTYRFSDDIVITEQNIRQIGELIALNSVRTRMIHSTRDLYYVFQCLYKDIYCHTDNLKPYSEAYDYAEAYERYDKLIAKMALPDYEYETLLAMMNTKRSIFIKHPSIKSEDVIFLYPNCALQYSLGFIFELLYSVYFFSLKITNVYLRLE